MNTPGSASRRTTVGLTVAALTAFAANSVLCRLALQAGEITPALFTAVRLASGALALVAITLMRRGSFVLPRRGSLGTALALLAYATCFSFGYVVLDTGTGALILFAAVQFSMIAGDLVAGHRMNGRQWAGALVSFAGLACFVSPGASAPDPSGALLMAVSGVAWGVYSLWGRGRTDPLQSNADNFVLASLVSVPILALFGDPGATSLAGVLLAVASGALASGVGYAIWYAALGRLGRPVAAVSQLSVPLIAAGGGTVFLGEGLGLRFALAALLVLGGIVLVVMSAPRTA